MAVINTWVITNPGSLTSSAPTINATPIANTAGNTLVAAIVGGAGNQIFPVFTVSDDGHSRWVFGGRRIFLDGELEFWVAPAARAASSVSIGASTPCAGICGVILEMTGLPAFAQAVATPGTNNVIGTSVTAGTTASAACNAFSIMAVSDLGFTPTIGVSAGWTIQATQSNGGTSTDSHSQVLSVATRTAAAGSVSATWTSGSSAELTALTVAFATSPTAPAQPNADWPAVAVEAAFGFQPGASNQIPTWTDITSRCLTEAGVAGVTATRGRDYELTQPDAGELTIQLNNQDGAFNPNSTASPYYPNVTLELPVRVTATWNNVTYGVAHGYVSSLPQQFPNPQWGYVEVTANDGVSILSNINLGSCLAGELLTDNPYVYLPCTEFFNTAGGEPFGNAARLNVKPGYGYNGNGTNLLATGLTLSIAGDPGSGIGISSFSAISDSRLPGIRYMDYSIPQPLANGCTIECVSINPVGPADSQKAAWTQVMAVEGPAGNYYQAQNPAGVPYPQHNGRMALILSCQPPGATGPMPQDYYFLGFQDYSGNLFTVGPQPFPTQNPNDGNPHHHALTLAPSGFNWAYVYYLDGALVTAGTTVNVGPFADVNAISLGNPPGPGGMQPSDGWNWSAGQLCYTAQDLPQYRIADHATAALTAWSGVTASTRFGQLMAWSGLSLPRGGTSASVSPLIGNADQIQGQAVAGAVGELTTEEGGMFFTDANGVSYYKSRQSLYNKAVKYTFGDNVSGGEVAYAPTGSFGYENTFLYNITNAQRTISSGTDLIIFDGGSDSFGVNSYGANAFEADTSSETQYFPRGPLEQPIETTSDQDAYDRASWSLYKYRQPVIRAAEIVITPSSNPAFWPAALGVEQGDIVQVNRRPLDAPAYGVVCVVQKVSHNIGPGLWQTTLSLAPYYPEDNVLQLDTAGFDTVGAAMIGW